MMDHEKARAKDEDHPATGRADQDSALQFRAPDADRMDGLLAGFEHRGTQHAKGAAGTGGAAATAAAARLTEFSGANPDLGEQIVGSEHDHKFIAPMNIHDQVGMASIQVSGDGFILVSSPQITLMSTRQKDFWTWHSSYSPLVRFAPKRPGTHSGAITFTASWYDGRTETKTLALTATARTLDQVGKRGETDTGAGLDPEEVAKRAADRQQIVGSIGRAGKTSKATPEDWSEFDAALPIAINSANALSHQQRRGVELVEKEAAAYQKRAPVLNRSLWWDLGMMALTVATGGTANVVAKQLAPRLVGVLGRAVNGLRAVDEVKPSGDPTVDMVNQVEAQARAEATTAIPRLGPFTTDAIRLGIRGALDAVLKPKGSAAKADDAAPLTAEHGESANGRIDFFEHQQDILDATATRYGDLVKEQAASFRSLVHVAPREAIEAVRAIGESFEQAHPGAKQEHANATAPQFVALVARSTLGTTEIKGSDLAPGVDDDKVVDRATDMSKLRVQGKKDGVPDGVAGVLDLVLDKEGPGARIVRARLNGVAQELVERLKKRPLRSLRMPIRLVLGTNLAKPTIVTVDEAGRIRASGNYESLAKHHGWSEKATTEQQAYRGTEALVESLLDQSLAALGVEPEHDDNTGLGG